MPVTAAVSGSQGFHYQAVEKNNWGLRFFEAFIPSFFDNL